MERLRHSNGRYAEPLLASIDDLSFGDARGRSAGVNVVNLSPNLLIGARDGDNDALLARLKMLPHVSV